MKAAKKRWPNYAVRRIDAVATALSVPLRDQVADFKNHMRRLSPFEAALAKLTIQSLEREGRPSLRSVFATYDAMRRAVVIEGRAAAADARLTDNRREAELAFEEGVERVSAVFDEHSDGLIELIRTVQLLRKSPVVSMSEPVVVLLGMPNVGKSSLVTACSTGTPEINSYPFTTRRLKMGHVVGDGVRFQLMDTPGVLARPDKERNPMEGLTLAAANLLPAALVFVSDLSGECGEQSAPHLQLATRDAIRAQFPHRPWLEVCAKSDLPPLSGFEPPPSALSVSVHTGHNMDELSRRLAQLVDELERTPSNAPADHDPGGIPGVEP